MSISLKPVEEKLDQLISLLKIIAGEKIIDKRRMILSTPKKLQIYELSDGDTEMGELAKKAKVSGEYTRLTIRELEDAGFVTTRSEGSKRYPRRVI